MNPPPLLQFELFVPPGQSRWHWGLRRGYDVLAESKTDYETRQECQAAVEAMEEWKHAWIYDLEGLKYLRGGPDGR